MGRFFQLLTWISLYGLIESKGLSGNSKHSVTSGKASARGARAGPSIMQGARVTKNQQLNITLSPRVIKRCPDP